MERKYVHTNYEKLRFSQKKKNFILSTQFGKKVIFFFATFLSQPSNSCQLKIFLACKLGPKWSTVSWLLYYDQSFQLSRSQIIAKINTPNYHTQNSNTDNYNCQKLRKTPYTVLPQQLSWWYNLLFALVLKLLFLFQQTVK